MPSFPMLHASFVVAALVGVLPAQTATVVPALCQTLPGNAGLAMPLRWSQGTLQVFVDAPLLPAGMAGQTILGLRLRRSTLLGDVANPPLTRTLTIRGGFQAQPSWMMFGSLSQNRPASTQVLFGPAVVTTNATPAPGPTTVVGADLLDVDFTTPLPVTAGTLFLEFEVANGPLQVSTAHWVDAVWFPSGADSGYAVTVGDGSCTTRSESTQLRLVGAVPSPGASGTLEVRGAQPSSAAGQGLVVQWAGLNPEASGFGAPLTLLDPALVGCHLWAPFDVSWSGPTDTQGVYSVVLPVPGTAALGTRIGVQAAWLDASRPGLPFSFSNGLLIQLGSVGVGSQCASLFFPGTATVSPWSTFLGQMPVLVF